MGSSRRPGKLAKPDTAPAIALALERKNSIARTCWRCDCNCGGVLDLFQQNGASVCHTFAWRSREYHCESCHHSTRFARSARGYSSHNPDCRIRRAFRIPSSTTTGIENHSGAPMKLLVWGIAALLYGAIALTDSGLAQSSPTDGGTAIQRVWEKDSPGKVAQSVRVDGGVVPREKFGFHWETRIAPSISESLSGFSTRSTDSNGVIHRVMLDRLGRTYFGYDVLVDVLPESNTFRVTFRPLVMTSAMAQGLSMDSWSAWTPLAAPRFPPPQTVRSGEIMELTLLTNSATNQKIVDYVAIQEPTVKGTPVHPPQDRDFSYATGTARDITSNDVEMWIKAPRLTINGKLEESTALHSDDVTGAFIWFYVPKHGLFILTLGPHAELGFHKAGEVRGSSLLFTLGTDSYTLSAGARIAPGQAAFNLYVLHEPDWKPAYLFADVSAFSIGATNQFESISK